MQIKAIQETVASKHKKIRECCAKGNCNSYKYIQRYSKTDIYNYTLVASAFWCKLVNNKIHNSYEEEHEFKRFTGTNKTKGSCNRKEINMGNRKMKN